MLTPLCKSSSCICARHFAPGKGQTMQSATRSNPNLASVIAPESPCLYRQAFRSRVRSIDQTRRCRGSSWREVSSWRASMEFSNWSTKVSNGSDSSSRAILSSSPDLEDLSLKLVRNSTTDARSFAVSVSPRSSADATVDLTYSRRRRGSKSSESNAAASTSACCGSVNTFLAIRLMASFETEPRRPTDRVKPIATYFSIPGRR